MQLNQNLCLFVIDRSSLFALWICIEKKCVYFGRLIGDFFVWTLSELVKFVQWRQIWKLLHKLNHFIASCQKQWFKLIRFLSTVMMNAPANDLHTNSDALHSKKNSTFSCDISFHFNASNESWNVIILMIKVKVRICLSLHLMHKCNVVWKIICG